MTTSDVNGNWSLTLAKNCAYIASFYWQSKSSGPLVKEVSYVPFTSSYTLNIWRTAFNTPLIWLLANNPQASLSVEVTSSFDVSINAQFSAGFNVGFLGVNAGGKVGTDVTLQSQNAGGCTTPCYAYMASGVGWKIQDTSGRSLVYVQKFTKPAMGTLPATEYMTADQALSRGAAQFNLVPGSYVTHTDTVTNVVSYDANLQVTLFGVSLTLEGGTSNTSSQSSGYTITNNTPNNECFVVFYQGPNIHAWLYRTGTPTQPAC